MFVCHHCFLVHEQNFCPVCGAENLPELCPNDNPLEYDQLRATCDHNVGSIAFCKVCGEPVCPICGCHDVTQISRVTGYLSNVSGWNAGKVEELKNRSRCNIC